MKIYGPYKRNDNGRMQVVILYDDGQRSTQLYSRYLYEQHYWVKLDASVHIDHVDNDPANDVIENLQAISGIENAKKAAALRPKKMVSCICLECTTEFSREARRLKSNQGAQKKPGPFCGRKCAGRYNARLTK